MWRSDVMGFCRTCGSQLKVEQEFCPQCGAKIDQRIKQKSEAPQKQTNTLKQPSRPLFNSKKTKIIVVAGIVTFIMFLSSYFFIKRITAPEAIAEKFIEAMLAEDVATVQNFLDDGQHGLQLDDEQIEQFLEYINDHPQILTAFSEKLLSDAKKYEGNVITKEKENATTLVKLSNKGSKWILFDDYQVEINTFYIEVNSDLENTGIYLNDEKVGSMEEFTKTIGPVLPGKYTVKVVYDGDFGKVEQTKKIDTIEHDDETLTLEFQWSEYFISIASNYEDAVLYVNNESTKMQIGELTEIGPVPKDGSVRVHAQKKFEDEVKKSEEILLTSNVARANLEIDYQEPKKEQQVQSQPEQKPTPEPQPQPVERIPTSYSYHDSSIEESAIANTIFYHYNTISADDFRAAYHVFSADRKSKVTYDGWVKGLQDNIQDVVTTLNVTEINGKTAKAYIEMTSYDQQKDGKTLVQQWAGNWNLVKESDGWKLHKADIEKKSSWSE